MSILLRVLLGLGIAAIGSLLVIRTAVVIDMFGYVEWAESKLGGGGTNLFYKAVGLAIIFVGFMVATDLWDAFLSATLGSLLPRV